MRQREGKIQGGAGTAQVAPDAFVWGLSNRPTGADECARPYVSGYEIKPKSIRPLQGTYREPRPATRISQGELR